jgi:hypothetical protein
VKRGKFRRLIRDVLEAERVLGPHATLDTLTINWHDRTVRFRGSTIKGETDILTVPVVSTERMLFGREGTLL